MLRALHVGSIFAKHICSSGRHWNFVRKSLSECLSPVVYQSLYTKALEQNKITHSADAIPSVAICSTASILFPQCWRVIGILEERTIIIRQTRRYLTRKTLMHLVALLCKNWPTIRMERSNRHRQNFFTLEATNVTKARNR